MARAVRKRFAIVSPNYYPVTCGVGDHSMRVAAELRRRGHDAIIFTRAPATPNPEAPDVPVSAIRESWPTRIANGIAREIAGGDFTNVIIQYTPRMWDASRIGSPALPLLAGRLRRLPVQTALVVHEPYTPWRARPDLAVGAALLRAQLAVLIRATQRQFVTTESRRGLVSGTFRVAGAAAPAVLRVGANAVPPGTVWQHGGHRIGVFSTLAFGKNFDAVLDAFEEVSGTFPDAELVLLGDFGPSTGAASKALAKRIARSPHAERIRVTGKLPLGDVARIVSTLNVYFFPMNTGANTRSGTLPVALAAGIPVVATRGIETDSLFVGDANVLFADRLDGPSFASRAIQVFRDPSLAARLSAGGRQLYADHLSWPSIVDSLLSALD
jgi:glycosyltransferase involved in cell wall biosynthesis